MNGTLELGLPSAGSRSAVGSLSLISIVRAILGLDGQDEAHELLADGVAGGPAPDRRDAILGGHRLAVVPLEAGAQGEGIGELVGGHLGRVDHLRPDRAVGIGGEQRVVDHVAVVADDEGGVPDRIEDLQVGVHDDAQHRLRLGRTGGGQHGGDGRQAAHEMPSATAASGFRPVHGVSPITLGQRNATRARLTGVGPTVAGRPREDNPAISAGGQLSTVAAGRPCYFTARKIFARVLVNAVRSA